MASSWNKRLGVGLLLLLALALRLYLLEHQSLWADEGNSVAMAPRAPLDIIQRTANDIHPPLYYLLLHYWTALVDTSVFAVRALSVLVGVVAVAFTYALAKRLSGRALVAVVAAFLLAISPFAIHYSQETRMYMLVTALGAASWWGWLVWDKRKVDGGALFYFIVTLAMIYSHYYAVPVVVAQNIAWLIALKDEREALATRLRVWVVVQGAILLLYLPWLWYAHETILNWPSISAPVTLEFMVGEIARIFTLGLANEGLPLWVGILVTLLLLAGVVAALRHPNGYVALLYFVVPPALMLLLSLDRPFWNPKFLLIALPGYCLLLGMGVQAQLAALPRWGKSPIVQGVGVAVVLALFAVATTPALENEYHNPRYARDDYKGIVNAIMAQAGATDAILLDGAGQREIFDYYYEGDLAVYGLPASQPLDVAATEATLADIKEEHPQVWVLWWAEQQGDPELRIPAWLNANTFVTESRWYGNVRLERYVTSEPPLTPIAGVVSLPDAETRGVVYRYDNQYEIVLEGVGIGPTTVTAGGVVSVYSEWDGGLPVEMERLPEPLIFAQLLDAGNHVIGQYDENPAVADSARWGENVELPIRMGISIPVGTIPGEYRLIIGAYDRATGQRFVSALGDAVQVGTIRVNAPPTPPSVESIQLPNGQRMAAPFAGFTLVAAQANRLGADHAPETPLRAGEPLSVLLYWQVRDAAALPTVTLQLRDENAQVRAEWQLTVAEGNVPPEPWRVDDLIRDLHTYFLPADLPPGAYKVVVTDGARTEPIGTITVTDAP